MGCCHYRGWYILGPGVSTLHLIQRFSTITFCGILLLLSVTPTLVAAQEAKAKAGEPTEREQKLAKFLNGATLVGKFTIDGMDIGAKDEEYTISKCEKLPQADRYRMTARIKYGNVDSEVPLDIKILWSGSTPVITLDAFWIPGMGTFGSRVLIQGDRYAGTWQHDDVGGHMFGKIKTAE